VVTPLACSLVGKAQWVTIVPDTRAAGIWGAATALEDFRCNYGVDRAYHPALTQAGLGLSGFGDEGELRSDQPLARRRAVSSVPSSAGKKASILSSWSVMS